MTNAEKTLLVRQFLETMKRNILIPDWHWFSWHFERENVTAFALSIIEACVDCEEKIPRLGEQFLSEICAIGGANRYLPHYDQLLQKLAEILVLRQLLFSEWPVGTTFQHEPAIIAGGKRPELKVNTPTKEYLFEVKTPSMNEHIRQRGANNLQIPGRILPRDLINRIANGEAVTLPRDNPIKDFLIDADSKFAEFKRLDESISLLIIVWDDHIYEPITSLTNEASGLLTPNSFYRTDDDVAINFDNIDGVVLVRHLLYFADAAAERPMRERRHAFDFGNADALPNVFIPVPNGEEVREEIRSYLRALPLDHLLIRNAAEYHNHELIFWI